MGGEVTVTREEICELLEGDEIDKVLFNPSPVENEDYHKKVSGLLLKNGSVVSFLVVDGLLQLDIRTVQDFAQGI